MEFDHGKLSLSVYQVYYSLMGLVELIWAWLPPFPFLRPEAPPGTFRWKTRLAMPSDLKHEHLVETSMVASLSTCCVIQRVVERRKHVARTDSMGRIWRSTRSWCAAECYGRGQTICVQLDGKCSFFSQCNRFRGSPAGDLPCPLSEMYQRRYCRNNVIL